ncbi:hypothetical protein PCH_Pc12g06360 [Penicillium rubens Wisconsin 54-1255]|uniref:PR-toxin biosynthesis cluster protein 10 n=1 Tax=Penicillium rubens (strain ATCC 28089 / DSM 1075 / NRRL 1951 / Wisconsin 54-1255) TaxID=500485 RepID=PRX10_PENRW|nr:RecName: Full=PR-toxin biosynthesis cluster protein 10 [Penicillium rubens Wisconsin 54-1255]CAP80263.1 hypothetical protein PCH_Pc12g06360 [Penicillium rubens Wisconsin 54-1255]
MIPLRCSSAYSLLIEYCATIRDPCEETYTSRGDHNLSISISLFDQKLEQFHVSLSHATVLVNQSLLPNDACPIQPGILRAISVDAKNLPCVDFPHLCRARGGCLAHHIEYEFVPFAYTERGDTEYMIVVETLGDDADIQFRKFIVMYQRIIAATWKHLCPQTFDCL